MKTKKESNIVTFDPQGQRKKMKLRITLRIGQIAESKHDLKFDFSKSTTHNTQEDVELFLQETNDKFLSLLLDNVFWDIEETLTDSLVNHIANNGFIFLNPVLVHTSKT